MKLSSILLFAAWTSHQPAKGDHHDLRTCDANPECAALGLADDCCPTNLAGIFLDCCKDPEPACEANAGCRGLVDDCCPTADGTFLYCCFDPDPTHGGYKYDYTYFAGPGATGTPWAWTGLRLPSTGQTGYTYRRNVELLYDLIYVVGSIPNVGDYVTGERKFSINIESDSAPDCTQILLQFEYLTTETVSAPGGVTYLFDKPYPEGRHSRYLATLSEDGGRIEFNFLDRPDENVLDSQVNAISLLIAPGTFTDDVYSFSRLDSYTACNGGAGCEWSPTNACPALYVTGESPSAVRALQEEEAECSDCANPSCVGIGQCSMAPSLASLEEAAMNETTVPELEEAQGEESSAAVSVLWSRVCIAVAAIFGVFLVV